MTIVCNFAFADMPPLEFDPSKASKAFYCENDSADEGEPYWNDHLQVHLEVHKLSQNLVSVVGNIVRTGEKFAFEAKGWPLIDQKRHQKIATIYSNPTDTIRLAMFSYDFGIFETKKVNWGVGCRDLPGPKR